MAPQHNLDPHIDFDWAQNCDNWFEPKWQSVEYHTTITQSTIIYHAAYHQPARLQLDVIKTSMSVLHCAWMLLGEKTWAEQGGLWVTLHFTDVTSTRYNIQQQIQFIFHLPFDTFRTSCLPEPTFGHLLMLWVLQCFGFIGILYMSLLLFKVDL